MTLFQRRYSINHIVILIGILLCSANLIAQQKKKITPEIAFKTPPLQLTKQLPNITSWLDDKTYIESKKKEGEEIGRAHV